MRSSGQSAARTPLVVIPRSAAASNPPLADCQRKMQKQVPHRIRKLRGRVRDDKYGRVKVDVPWGHPSRRRNRSPQNRPGGGPPAGAGGSSPFCWRCPRRFCRGSRGWPALRRSWSSLASSSSLATKSSSSGARLPGRTLLLRCHSEERSDEEPAVGRLPAQNTKAGPSLRSG